MLIFYNGRLNFILESLKDTLAAYPNHSITTINVKRKKVDTDVELSMNLSSPSSTNIHLKENNTTIHVTIYFLLL
jgi:hypothetical protein